MGQYIDAIKINKKFVLNIKKRLKSIIPRVVIVYISNRMIYYVNPNPITIPNLASYCMVSKFSINSL